MQLRKVDAKNIFQFVYRQSAQGFLTSFYNRLYIVHSIDYCSSEVCIYFPLHIEIESISTSGELATCQVTFGFYIREKVSSSDTGGRVYLRGSSIELEPSSTCM